MRKEEFREMVISLRNIFLGNPLKKDQVFNLKKLIESLDCIEINNIRNVFCLCLGEAIQQAEKGRFVSAGYILNLVHNLPIARDEVRGWDINYFISVELPAFLDRYDEIDSVNRVTLLTCKCLADEFMEDISHSHH